MPLKEGATYNMMVVSVGPSPKYIRLASRGGSFYIFKIVLRDANEQNWNCEWPSPTPECTAFVPGQTVCFCVAVAQRSGTFEIDPCKPNANTQITGEPMISKPYTGHDPFEPARAPVVPPQQALPPPSPTFTGDLEIAALYMATMITVAQIQKGVYTGPVSRPEDLIETFDLAEAYKKKMIQMKSGL